MGINRLVNGLYGVLVLGAASRLVSLSYYPQVTDPTVRTPHIGPAPFGELLSACLGRVGQVLTPVDRAYWWLLVPVFLLGLSLAATQLLGDTREAVNDWVVEHVDLLYAHTHTSHSQRG